MVATKKKGEEKHLNGELLTLPINEQPPLWPLAHLQNPRKRNHLWAIKQRYNF
jgi:hypothetical protein